MWTLPRCTCPRDDSGDTRGCEKHDSRSYWNTATQFFAEASPCEACGEPTYEARVWNPEYELWIATDCSCSTPQTAMPVCPDLYALMMIQDNVGELVKQCKQHKLTCPRCNPVLPLPAKREPTGEPVNVIPEAA